MLTPQSVRTARSANAAPPACLRRVSRSSATAHTLSGVTQHAAPSMCGTPACVRAGVRPTMTLSGAICRFQNADPALNATLQTIPQCLQLCLPLILAGAVAVRGVFKHRGLAREIVGHDRAQKKGAAQGTSPRHPMRRHAALHTQDLRSAALLWGQAAEDLDGTP